jgi:hypothetical protein
MHEVISENTGSPSEVFLVMDAETFCLHIIDGARKWAETNKANPAIAANMLNLVHLRPCGISPNISGFPVIA